WTYPAARMRSSRGSGIRLISAISRQHYFRISLSRLRSLHVVIYMLVSYMDATIIIRLKPCSKPGRGHWMLLHKSIHAAQELFLRQKEHCNLRPGSLPSSPKVRNMKDVILIDAGTGNLRSVQKALECVGAEVQ